MTGTSKPRGRPKGSVTKKQTAPVGTRAAKADVPAEVKPKGRAAAPKVAPQPKAKTPVRAKTPKPVPAMADAAALENVAELTAADLVAPAEVTVPVVADIPAPEKIEETSVEEPVMVAEAIENVPETSVTQIIEPQAVIETLAAAGQGVEQKGTEIMSDVMETTKKYAEEAKERFQTAFFEISEKAKAGVEKSTKALEELSDIAKGNVEAIVESGKIASKGMESMGQEAAEYGRVSFEKASAAMKSLAAVKTPTEFFQLQSELLSSSFDAFAKESAKTSEVLLKLRSEEHTSELQSH